MKSFLTRMNMVQIEGESYIACVGRIKTEYFDTLVEIIEKLDKMNNEKPKTLEIHVREQIGTADKQIT